MMGRAKGKRVLMIVENNPVPSDRRVWQEATALRDAGYDVSIISPRHARAPRLRETIDGIRVMRHPRAVEASKSWQYIIEYTNALFWELLLSLWVLVRRGADVVHIANPPDNVFLLAPLFRLAGTKVVFDQHDLSPEIYEAKYDRRGKLWQAVLAAERLSHQAADIVITPNESMRQLVIGRGGKKPDDVFVVRNGPDLDRFKRVVESDASSDPTEPQTVCYMGIIGEQEGLESYLRVIADIVQSRGRPQTRFLIVGDGSGLAQLKAQATEMGLIDHIEFTGFLGGSELTEALASADVCVVPEPVTALTEHSTLVKTMEYMAMGKPVVQYDLPEGRVTSGDTSLYAARDDETDLADKIVYLLDNPEIGARLGSEAAQRVRDSLAWPMQIPDLLTAYETVLTGVTNE